MRNENRPLEGLNYAAFFDFDSTLRDPTKDIYGSALMGTLKLSRGLIYALYAYSRKKIGLDTRDEFAAKAPALYQRLLVENGVTRMNDFYLKAARNTERIHAGSIELISKLIKKNIGIALITGSDEDFVRIFLENNGIDPKTKIEILGSSYEKTPDGTGYTGGKVLKSNVDSAGKQRVITELMEKYPGIQIVVSGGDDEADKPATHKVIPSGLRLVVGKDKDFHCKLIKDGYILCTSVEKYLAAPESKRVLIVSKDIKPGEPTFIDVHSRLDELLPKTVEYKT